MKYLFFSFALMVAANFSLAQANSDQYILFTKKAQSPIKIDGVLDETDWSLTSVAKDFKQNSPDDTQYADSKTEVRMLFDGENLYVGAVMYGQSPQEYTVASLKRDFDFRGNDHFAIYLDPFRDRNSGIFIWSKPYGSIKRRLIGHWRATQYGLGK